MICYHNSWFYNLCLKGQGSHEESRAGCKWASRTVWEWMFMDCWWIVGGFWWILLGFDSIAPRIPPGQAHSCNRATVNWCDAATESDEGASMEARLWRKSIEHLSKAYRTPIEHLLTIDRNSMETRLWRTLIENLSNNYRKSIEHLSKIYGNEDLAKIDRKCNEDLSNIYRNVNISSKCSRKTLDGEVDAYVSGLGGAKPWKYWKSDGF